ncbi:MAG: fluoride efflux transporter CrcB [Planctomycetota bacterium]|jgi:CrcB protein
MVWLTQLGAVALGGAIGASSRWGVSLALKSPTTGHFPWSTLCVNLLGCLLIGICAAWFASHGEHDAPGKYAVRLTESHHLLLMVGVLGGFTTFSTFAIDTLSLWAQGQRTMAMAYVLLSNVGGLLGVVVGWWLVERSIA